MDKNIVNRKQQMRLLLLEVLGFVLVFSFVGMLINFFYTSSVYTNSDQQLAQQVRDSQQFIDFQKNGGPRNNNVTNQNPSLADTPNNDQGLAQLNGPVRGGLQVLFLDDNNKILNNQNIGDQFSVFKNVEFKKTATATKPKTLKINEDYYRYAVVPLKQKVDSANGEVKKIVILAVFNSEMNNIESFKNVLISSLLAGLAWALLISWWISQRMMQPIINSWQQQQEFVDSAAHELRTPLTIIQNKMENLLRNPHAKVSDVSENIVLSLKEVRRLNQLTSDMLTLARSGSNATRLDPEYIDLKPMLKEVLLPYQEIAKEEGKKLTVKIDVDHKMNVDVKRLHQLIVILLDNSIKYTKKGDRINFEANVNKNNLNFSVANSGPEIPDETKKKIFERFYREEKSGNRKTGGSGLGLSISQWIVEAYNGKIQVEDWHKTSPKGVVFKVSLPEIKVKNIKKADD